jgi:hypothetical protein
MNACSWVGFSHVLKIETVLIELRNHFEVRESKKPVSLDTIHSVLVTNLRLINELNAVIESISLRFGIFLTPT